ncbi:MAG: hypothetical protein BKP49_10500 [Treponema sp. CETP13]|nr:MAG: hypothetical protein BKP49_10500 [Treponema sp. CETP13]
MAVVKAISSKASLKTAIKYITQAKKTKPECIVGQNCTPETALGEMETTKALFKKNGGRQYQHFVISYHADEKITHEQALKNAVELIQKNAKFDDFECLFATHFDKKEVHTHVIVNSVNAISGKKLHMKKSDLQEMKDFANNQSLLQGFHIPIKGRHFDGSKSTDVTAWTKDKYHSLERGFSGDFDSNLLKIGNAIVAAKKEAKSKVEFIELLQQQGIATKWTENRKTITFEVLNSKNKKKRFRNTNLQKTLKTDFTKENLLDEFRRNGKREHAERYNRDQAIKAKRKTYRCIGESIGFSKSENRKSESRETGSTGDERKLRVTEAKVGRRQQKTTRSCETQSSPRAEKHQTQRGQQSVTKQKQRAKYSSWDFDR